MTKDPSLTQLAYQVIRQKATERPHTGIYNNHSLTGTYLCRACGQALFRSHAKFSSSCGWPSFDAGLEKRILEEIDADGRRMEILCANCQAHLGHVFDGEGFTKANRRFCVNSLSLDFVSDPNIQKTEEAIIAGGCFWGVQTLLNKLPGVLKTEVGYTGGHSLAPSYEEVCTGVSGHYEAIRLLYDPQLLKYEELLKYFFEIHDPTQKNGQGPDVGEQYRSAIFYFDTEQQKIAQHLIWQLEQKGLRIATQLLPPSAFWPAEGYHQDYYAKTGKQPYCHRYIKRF